MRALALRHALSAKAQAGEIVVLDKAVSKDGKTAALKDQFAKLAWTNVLIIDGADLEVGFVQAARNLPNIDVLPVQGINVYDILRRKTLVLTKAAVAALEERFAGAPRGKSQDKATWPHKAQDRAKAGDQAGGEGKR